MISLRFPSPPSSPFSWGSRPHTQPNTVAFMQSRRSRKKVPSQEYWCLYKKDTSQCISSRTGSAVRHVRCMCPLLHSGPSARHKCQAQATHTKTTQVSRNFKHITVWDTADSGQHVYMRFFVNSSSLSRASHSISRIDKLVCK